jgi:anti-sigma regulatory factor (Ser/Thr protein kinase)
LTRRLAAREGAGFHGRRRELDYLSRAGADAARGVYRLIAVTGPAGAGRRELLRQAALHCWSTETPVLPLCWDWDEATLAPGAGRPSPWPALLTELLRLALLRLAEQSARTADPAAILTATAADLPARCAAVGAFALLPFAERLPRAESALLAPLLQALADLKLPPPMLLLSTSRQELPEAALPVLATFRRAGVATLASALPPAAAFADLPELEQLPLAPLEPSEALALAGAVGHRRGWSLGPGALEPILARLGPWPGWVLAWCAQYRAPSPGGNGLRAGEEAYLRLLSASGWARALEAELERVVPATLQGPVLDLLRQAARPGAVLAGAAMNACTGLRPSEGDAVLRALLNAGLLTATPEGLAGPRWVALRDWVTLAGDTPPGPGLLTPRQLDLLTQRLGAPRPLLEGNDANPHESASAMLNQALPRFRGQTLPEVLFHFADYHEALARLTPEQRRESLARATHTLHLPEVVGVARVEHRLLEGQRVALLVARAFTEGKYQRSHEQTWLIADLSAARLATTPEVRQVLEAFTAIEREQGVGRYTRWLVIGEGASAEALELIKAEKLLCSCREQLQFLNAMLVVSPEPRRAQPADAPPPAPLPEHTPPSNGAALRHVAAASVEMPPLVRHAVIDMNAPSGPSNELSRLSLPAREGSEYIAAMLAEKLALRADFSAIDAGKIKTAVLEGVLNAIEHSPNSEKLVDVEFRLSPEALEIVIENEGYGFDPLAVPPAPDPRAKLGARNKRGWGISLMRQFMDELDYDPCTRGTRLRLLKRRIAAPAQVPGKVFGEV